MKYFVLAAALVAGSAAAEVDPFWQCKSPFADTLPAHDVCAMKMLWNRDWDSANDQLRQHAWELLEREVLKEMYNQCKDRDETFNRQAVHITHAPLQPYKNSVVLIGYGNHVCGSKSSRQ